MLFENFLSDMGIRPDGLTIERIDNDHGYSPDNCRWATQYEQARNKRLNKFVTIGGKKMCIKDCAIMFGIKPNTLVRRLLAGWSLNRAITEKLYERKLR